MRLELVTNKRILEFQTRSLVEQEKMTMINPKTENYYKDINTDFNIVSFFYRRLSLGSYYSRNLNPTCLQM